MATGKNTDGTVAVITWGYKEDADFHFIQNFVNEFAQKYPNVKMVFHRLEYEDDEVLIITGDGHNEELFPDYCQNIDNLDAVGTIDWQDLQDKMNQVRVAYTAIGASGIPALKSIIEPLYFRLCRGEKTKELYDSIMDCIKNTLC